MPPEGGCCLNFCMLSPTLHKNPKNTKYSSLYCPYKDLFLVLVFLLYSFGVLKQLVVMQIEAAE